MPLYAQLMDPPADLTPLAVDASGRLLQALLVLIFTLYLARWARNAFLRASTRTRADVNTRYLVARLLALGVLFIGLATILAIFSVPLSAVVTFIGVVGLAISLAAQDILKNFFAGLYLLFERPFRIGDSIRVRDFSGTVEDIGVRTTILRSHENVQVLIPNAIVFAEIVLNRTFAQADVASSAPPPTAPSGSPAAVGVRRNDSGATNAGPRPAATDAATAPTSTDTPAGVDERGSAW